MSKQTKNVLMLVTASLIWGLAFVAQSMGADMPPFAFLACRSWLAIAVLVPVVPLLDWRAQKAGRPTGKPKTKAETRTLALAGLAQGLFLFVASGTQQYAMTIDPSTAKASFLTAMYVVLVPIAGLLFGRRCGRQIWLCVALCVAGLYLLCMQSGFGRLQTSDLWLLLCAVCFTGQILCIDYFAPRVDGVRMSLWGFVVVAVCATAVSLLAETVTIAALAENALPLLYCGVLSSGVAYTLQILGQTGLHPALASLSMCLESVFGAVGGWLLLNQVLSGREILGCGLIFAAVVLAQLPLDLLKRKKQTA